MRAELFFWGVTSRQKRLNFSFFYGKLVGSTEEEGNGMERETVAEKKDREGQLAEAIPRLVDWYRENRRELPWRQEPTSYHVWISEIMLQQTRIEAVIPYYRRFLAELPDVAALAAVSEDRLMKLWQGLGYYSRARNLKKAAEAIVKNYDGVLPRHVEELRALPGIGEYTAGAIASIAYGEPAPAVDGNVLRVLSRLFASDADIMLPAVKKEMTALLSDFYPVGEEAALLTEGLMELGEVVCIPNGEARCALCPLASLCRANAEGRVAELPVRSAPKKRKTEERTVLLLRSRAGEYAIAKRPEEGLLAGMWEFPNLPGRLSAEDVRSILSKQQLDLSAIAPCGKGKHIFSHVEWHMTGFSAEVDEPGGEYLWRTAEEIRRDYAVPTAYRMFLKQLL